MIKFDSSDNEKLERMAKASLEQSASKLLSELQTMIDDELNIVIADNHSTKRSRAKEKYAEIQSLALIFGFTRDITKVSAACRKILDVLYCYKQEKEEKKENKDQIQMFTQFDDLKEAVNEVFVR